MRWRQFFRGRSTNAVESICVSIRSWSSMGLEKSRINELISMNLTTQIGYGTVTFTALLPFAVIFQHIWTSYGMIWIGLTCRLVTQLLGFCIMQSPCTKVNGFSGFYFIFHIFVNLAHVEVVNDIWFHYLPPYFAKRDPLGARVLWLEISNSDKIWCFRLQAANFYCHYMTDYSIPCYKVYCITVKY